MDFIFCICICIYFIQLHIQIQDIKTMPTQQNSCKLNLRNIIIILVLTGMILIESGECAQRFKDEERMKKHHNHLNVVNDQLITVHLIPHSHDDVGWLKTVDNYFYGGDQTTQWAGVQYTIDTVVGELMKNETYKFSIVQVAFLYRWWNQATEKDKQNMRFLVKNNQIQFINGGWCMSDQATPYYEDVIDQMAIGHRWLKETFDYIPTIAWHIDPFGHQASSASMFSRMGLNAFFFARIDYQDKQTRMKQKSLQMIWPPNQYNGDSTNYIFTHVNYYHYSPPPGFCFDILCRDQAIKDNPDLEDYNIDRKSDGLVQYFKSMATHFRSNSLMHTLGQDFHYANAHMWYKNFDKLMNYINGHSEKYNMKFIYSTPGQYIKEINAQENKYPTKSDDFFPYGDDEHDYWTGYFTSRTGVKGFVREFGRWIQAIRKHISEIKITNKSDFVNKNGKLVQQNLWKVQMAQGILQHHDGVSGTQKQKVAYDYINTALRAIRDCGSMYQQIQKQLIERQIGQTNILAQNIYHNIFWNQTAKVNGMQKRLSTQGNVVLIGLYNPGAKGIYEIRINVPKKTYKLIDLMNKQIGGDVVCGNLYSEEDNCELIFNLNMQQGSTNYVKLQASNSGHVKIVSIQQFRIIDKVKEFNVTDNVQLKITRASQQFDLIVNGQTQTFLVGYKYYQSYQGPGQKSGAYIFRPANDTPKGFSSIKKIHWADGTQNLIVILEGDNTLTKIYFSKITSKIEKHGIELQTFINSISIDDNKGKQVTLNIKTNYNNEDTFYTDSNGLQQQKRILNYRPSWKFNITQHVAANYYPINSHIRIQDKANKKNLTLVTERSVGGSVINNGEFQIMLNRRTLYDDSRGVGQPINQTQLNSNVGLKQCVRHYLVFGNLYRQLQKNNDQKIMRSFIQTSQKQFKLQNLTSTPISVPQSVKLSLRPFENGEYLMRLHNMDPNSEIQVKLPEGWTTEELTLSANQKIQDWQKNQYKWKQQPTSLVQRPDQINEEWKQDLLNIESSIIIDSIDMIQRGVQRLNSQIEKLSKSTLGRILFNDIEQQQEYKRQQQVAQTITLKKFDLRTFKLVKS